MGAVRVRLAAAVCVLLCLGTASAVQAQPALSTSPFDRATANDPDARMLLEADQLVYDYDNDRVSAVGTVVIYYKGYAVEAAEVTYDQKSQRVYANGGVKVTEPDGNVIYADKVELSDDFREGFLEELTLVTPDNARFAAATAERIDDNTTIFNRGVYTACKPCQEHPERAPIWQFKAKRIIHDQKEKVVRYEDATFEMFGLPVAYTPYFQHPDPTVKRKSGFLHPEIHYTSDVGFSVGIPYFFNLAPNYDLTVEESAFSEQGLLTDVEWRHRLVNGAYSVRGAFIDQLNPDNFATYSGTTQVAGFQSDQKLRGFLETKGLFNINEFWQWGFQGHLLSDAKFYDDYYFTNATELRDNIFLTGMSASNYFDARIINYQLLQDVDTSSGLVFDSSGKWVGNTDFDNELPVVHPVVDYEYIFDNPVLGGQLSINSNFLSLSRSDPDFVQSSSTSACPLVYLEDNGSTALGAYDGATLRDNCRLLGRPGHDDALRCAGRLGAQPRHADGPDRDAVRFAARRRLCGRHRQPLHDDRRERSAGHRRLHQHRQRERRPGHGHGGRRGSLADPRLGGLGLPDLRADRAASGAARRPEQLDRTVLRKPGGAGGELPPERGRDQLRLRRHEPVRPRQVLGLRPRRGRHAAQRRHAVQAADQFGLLGERPVRPVLPARREQPLPARQRPRDGPLGLRGRPLHLAERQHRDRHPGQARRGQPGPDATGSPGARHDRQGDGLGHLQRDLRRSLHRHHRQPARDPGQRVPAAHRPVAGCMAGRDTSWKARRRS